MATAVRPADGFGNGAASYGFTYNAIGLPLTATDPDGVATTNSYDGAGNLTAAALDPAHLNLVTQFAYDDAGDAEIAEYDGGGALVRRFVPGPSVDEFIAMVTSGGTKTFVHVNRQGSVIAMSDAIGAIRIGIWRFGVLGETDWYSWVGSNHRPPDPQSGALTN